MVMTTTFPATRDVATSMSHMTARDVERTHEREGRRGARETARARSSSVDERAVGQTRT